MTCPTTKSTWLWCGCMSLHPAGTIFAFWINSQVGPYPCILFPSTTPVSLIQDKMLCKNNIIVVMWNEKCGLHSVLAESYHSSCQGRISHDLAPPPIRLTPTPLPTPALLPEPSQPTTLSYSVLLDMRVCTCVLPLKNPPHLGLLDKTMHLAS